MVEPHFLACDIVDRVRMVLRLERRLSRNQFIERYANRPAVYFLSVATAQKHLRSFVVASASIGEHLLVPSSQLHILALPEVDQLHDPSLAIVEYVLGLDVPMANALLVDVGERIEQFVEGEPEAVLIESRFE